MGAADESGRIDIEAALREVQPLPTIGRFGFGMACATLALVIGAQAVVWADSLTRLDNVGVFWSVAYAALLANGWYRMRPFPGQERAYGMAVVGLLFQGLSYFVYWAMVLGTELGVEREDLGSLVTDDTADLVLICVLASLVIVGPISGLFAAFGLARGGAMVVAQFFGFLFFFVV